MTADDRDQQIAHLIRSLIAKTEARAAFLKYPEGSSEAALYHGKIVGLREALALVDPQPWR